MSCRPALEPLSDRRAPPLEIAAERPAAAPSSAKNVERAFRLAYFIHPDRSLAMRVTVRALSHLDDLVAEQDRRRFFQPRNYRTKVSKSRSQLLQHLVCCVAEPSQVRRRRGDRTFPESADDLLIRFVVDLTRIAARRSSFYVNIAISRILHDYSTAETRAIHDFLTQDPERMRNDAYFRYGKGLLLKEMQHRFGSLIETIRESRGELRFCSCRPSPWQAALVGECQRLLTPWETRCPLPESFDPLQEKLPELCFMGDHPDDEHPVDMRRMHAVLHPGCYRKATRALGLDAPAQRLRIPQFFTAGNHGCRSELESRGRPDRAIARRQPRALSVEEKASIAAETRTIVERRRRWSIRQLSRLPARGLFDVASVVSETRTGRRSPLRSD